MPTIILIVQLLAAVSNLNLHGRILNGKTLEYDKLIEALEDDELYHTAKIIKYCNELGLFDYSFDYQGKKLNQQEKEYAMKKAEAPYPHSLPNTFPIQMAIVKPGPPFELCILHT